MNCGKKIGRASCCLLAIGALAAGYSATSITVLGEDEKQLAEWIRDLEDEDQAVRIKAAEGLISLGEKAQPAVPTLTKVLREQDPARHIEAIAVLMSIGPAGDQAVPVLNACLSHENFHVQYWACRALGKIGAASKPAVPKLIERLRDGAGSVRRNAAAALGDIGARTAPEIIEPLMAAVHDRLNPVREQALNALGKQGTRGQKAISVVRAAANDPTFSPRTPAARSLWLLTEDVDSAMLVLLAELNQGDEPWEAAKVLGEIGPSAKAAVPDLTKAVQSPDESTRMFAVEALGQIGPAADAALPVLRAVAQGDPEQEIRELARTAIKQIGG